MLQDRHAVKMLFCASEIRVVVNGVKSNLAHVLPCVLQGTPFDPCCSLYTSITFSRA